jgi:hypothetical protein
VDDFETIMERICVEFGLFFLTRHDAMGHDNTRHDTTQRDTTRRDTTRRDTTRRRPKKEPNWNQKVPRDSEKEPKGGQKVAKDTKKGRREPQREETNIQKVAKEPGRKPKGSQEVPKCCDQRDPVPWPASSWLVTRKLYQNGSAGHEIGTKKVPYPDHTSEDFHPVSGSKFFTKIVFLLRKNE